MGRLLDGSELVDFIKERQARQVRALRQAHHVMPKLVVIQTVDDAAIDSSVTSEQNYGADILVDIELFKVDQDQIMGIISRLNDDPSVHGISIQLPLADESMTSTVQNSVAPKKDVDGAGQDSALDSAGAVAINWLLAGYNVDLSGKKIVLIGSNSQIAKPVQKMWGESGHDITVFNDGNAENALQLANYDVVVIAANAQVNINASMIKQRAVIIDTSTAYDGEQTSDIAEDVRHRTDVSVTPEADGVGPLVIAALFENTIQAARSTILDASE